jgi:hypothetical protein
MSCGALSYTAELTPALRLLNAHNSWPITLSPVSKTNNRYEIQISVYALETVDTELS